jgi:hypothetical protein
VSRQATLIKQFPGKVALPDNVCQFLVVHVNGAMAQDISNINSII